MNGRIIMTGAVALMTTVLIADELTAKKPVVRTAAERAAIHQKMVARQGGEVVKPGSYAGWVAIVNKQTRIPDAECESVAKLFATSTKRNFKVVKDPAGAKLVLTVIDDPKEPKILVAPMDGWAKVNVADLVSDLPTQEAKDRFLAERARKLMIKALSILCGGASSNYPGNLMNVATVREMDTMQEQFPFDVMQRHDTYLKSIGVTSRVVATYRKACQEGWAPAPTNDVQKAIWDKVHALPKNPIKIEFDPKKGK